MKKLSQKEQGDLVSLLIKSLSDEWVAAFQYQVHASRLQGLYMDPVADHLKEHSEEEIGHADALTKHFYSHGLPIDLFLQDFDPGGSDTLEMLNMDLKDEISAINLYTQIIGLCNDVPELTDTQLLIEKILTDEIHHQDDLASFIKAKIDEREKSLSGAERVAVASTLVNAADTADNLGLKEFADKYTKFAAEI